MSDVPSRGLIAAIAAVLLVGLPVSVSGQSLVSSAGQAAQAGARPVKRLTVNEAVTFALEQNLSLRVQRLDPEVQDYSVQQAKGAWVPNLNSSFQSNNDRSPVGSFLSGAANQLKQDTISFGVGASQLLPWGGSYDVTWNNNRFASNSIFSSPNPALRAALNATYSQPILRNGVIDSARQQVLVTKKNREISDVQLHQSVLTTTRSVKNAYWDLKYAIAALRVQQQSLDLARESLKNNRARVEIGTMAPIDIVEAEAEVARREEAVILAEAQVAQAEDRLRTLIFDPATPDFWDLSLELVDDPVFEAQAIDTAAATRAALEKRTDLAQAKKTLESSDINIRYFRNQILPDLNVQAGYNSTGQGGTNILYGEGFPPSIIGQETKSWGETVKQMLAADYPSWSVGVSFAYPIGTSSQQANLARAKVSYAQSQIQLRNLELQVVTQVRDTARLVTTNLKRVGATGASRTLAERRLEAEQKKFAAGMSTSFLVFQAQRDLADAQNSYLSAVLEYNKSLVDFETVQEAPLGGSGAGVTAGTLSASGASAAVTSGLGTAARAATTSR